VPNYEDRLVSSRIPKDFIDQLLARVDIVEVIDQRLPLKKSGRDFKARCPFHDERTPSFTVSPNKQFYHCFGCSASGTAITFLIEFSHLNFREAVEELATSVGLDVPNNEYPTQQNHETSQLLQIVNDANNWFKAQLRHHVTAAGAIAYLKQRGITGEIAAHFEIGFAPDGWSNLTETIANQQDQIPLFVKAGLLANRDNGGYYDRFRSRIIFPIHDSRGRIVAFGGRILGDGAPKYLNSPETPIFHKSAELYNLHRARSAIAEQGYSLVVEGYTDVVSLAQRGIENSVATLGTATTLNHLKRLFRLASHVVFCFDGDRAGREAGWKALEAILSEMVSGRQASFLFLPEGEDPDSLIQKCGADSFRERIKTATPLPDFLFDTLLKNTSLDRIDGRARLAEIARPLLGQIPDGPFRELMQNQLEKLSGVRRQPKKPKTIHRKSNTGNSDHRLSPIATAVSLLIQNPSLASDVALPTQITLKNEKTDIGISLLTQIHNIANEHPDISSPALVERFRDEESFRSLQKLAIQNHLLDETNLISFYRETINTLEKQAVNAAINVLLSRSREEKLDDNGKAQLSGLYARREALRATREPI